MKKLYTLMGVVGVVLSLLGYRTWSLQTELQSMQKQKQQLTQKLNKTQHELDQTESKLADTETKLANVQQQVSALQQGNQELRRQMELKDVEIKRLQGKVAKLDKQLASIKKRDYPQMSRGETKVKKEFYVEATAYTAYCKGCSGITKWKEINLRKNPHLKIIAVDPKLIPLGSKVYVEGYGYAIAADTGGGIDGYEIDIFMPNVSDAIEWGRKRVRVRVLN